MVYAVRLLLVSSWNSRKKVGCQTASPEQSSSDLVMVGMRDQAPLSPGETLLHLRQPDRAPLPHSLAFCVKYTESVLSVRLSRVSRLDKTSVILKHKRKLNEI